MIMVYTREQGIESRMRFFCLVLFLHLSGLREGLILDTYIAFHLLATQLSSPFLLLFLAFLSTLLDESR